MDAAPAFDPFRAERHAHWHNRWRRWRADAAQTAFHAVALLALVALLTLPLARMAEALAPIARETLARGGIWFAFAAVIVMAGRHTQRLATLRRQQAQEWLAAQPIAQRWQAHRRRDRVHADWWLHVAGGSALLALIDATPGSFAAFLACATLAALLAPPLARHWRARERSTTALIARITDSGAGRVWRWQRREAAVALRGARLARGAWALLLVPMGSGLFAVLMIASAGLLLALLATAWQRSLAVLPQAQAWLGAQPRSGRHCLRESVGVPWFVLTTAIVLVTALAWVLGATGLGVAAMLGLLTFGGLHFACVAAYRAQPRRLWWSLPVHFILLLAALQALPPLAPLCWAMQMAWLLRQARRP